MIGTNHYLFGVATASVVKNPVLALPLAFVSHFVLDMLPHFGVKPNMPRRGKILLGVSIVDLILLAIMVLLTFQNYPSWYVLAGVIAVSPDFAWAYRFVFKERFGKFPPGPRNAFNAWHANIQKLERLWGVFVDAAFCGLLWFLLF